MNVKTKHAQISETTLHRLSDEMYPEPAGGINCFEQFDPSIDDAQIWPIVRDEILSDWTAGRPGTRPESWWKFDAPEPQRRRLSGIGDPQHEHLNVVPSFSLGIPDVWVQPWDVELYNGRLLDVHGKKILDYREGDFTGLAIDRDDPPVYESQTAYLARLNLLTAEEQKHTAKHPELLEPEVVDVATEADA